MRLPKLIALLCQAWLLDSRAALIERRGDAVMWSGFRPARGIGPSFVAARKSPTQIDAVGSLLDRAMGFDEAHVRVHGQILRHRHVGVEPYRGQATALGLADGVIHEPPPQALALPRRVDRNVVDEV